MLSAPFCLLLLLLLPHSHFGKSLKHCEKHICEGLIITIQALIYSTYAVSRTPGITSTLDATCQPYFDATALLQNQGGAAQQGTTAKHTAAASITKTSGALRDVAQGSGGSRAHAQGQSTGYEAASTSSGATETETTTLQTSKDTVVSNRATTTQNAPGRTKGEAFSSAMLTLTSGNKLAEVTRLHGESVREAGKRHSPGPLSKPWSPQTSAKARVRGRLREHLSRASGLYGGRATIVTGVITSAIGCQTGLQHPRGVLEHVTTFEGQPLSVLQYQALPTDTPIIKPGTYRLLLADDGNAQG